MQRITLAKPRTTKTQVPSRALIPARIKYSPNSPAAMTR